MNKSHPVVTDLNLLRVFLAISELRSLTAAGERLGLTQPAVSHALRRLRNLFDDPLFVRTPTGMAPTDAARQLHGPLTRAFDIIDLAVQQVAHFDPATANRVFRISMSDMSEFYFLPPLLAKLAEVAPGVRVEIASAAVEAVGAAMRSGERPAARRARRPARSVALRASLPRARVVSATAIQHPDVSLHIYRNE